MKGILKWIGRFVAIILIISAVILISPLVLLVALIAWWHFTKKNPNDKYATYAKYTVIVSGIGFLIFIYSIFTDTDTNTETELEPVVEEVVMEEAEAVEEREDVTEEIKKESEEKEETEEKEELKEVEELEKEDIFKNLDEEE